MKLRMVLHYQFSVYDNVVKSVYEKHAAAAVFDSHGIAMHSFTRHQGVLYYAYLSLFWFLSIV